MATSCEYFAVSRNGHPALYRAKHKIVEISDRLLAYTALDDLSEKLASDSFAPCAVVETSAGNFQRWLKHTAVLLKLLGTFVAQTLMTRYDADPSAAD